MEMSADRVDRIANLTPRQSLDVLQHLTAWLGEQSTDQRNFKTDEQIDILNALFQQEGYAPLPLSPDVRPDEDLAGEAARQLLIALAESGDGGLLAELDYWLANPPKAQTKALIELVVVPIVLTACVAALGTSFEIERKDGKTRFKSKRTGISAKDLKHVLPGLYGAMKNLIGMA
jgi:hypothetical protein